jgi:hypothetical protein
MAESRGFISRTLGGMFSNALYDTLKVIFGGGVVALGAVIWQYIKHRPVDWWGMLALGVFVALILGLLLRIHRLPEEAALAVSDRPPRQIQKLKIISAVYGSNETEDHADVTETLQGLAIGDTLAVTINKDLFGDPAIGKAKRLQVSYSYGSSAVVKIERRESDLMVLPEDTFLKEQAGARQKHEEQLRSQREHIETLHRDEVRRLEATHAADLSRALIVQDQLRAEKREGLDKFLAIDGELKELRGKMLLPSSYATPAQLRGGVVSLLGGLYALLIDNGDDPCGLPDYRDGGPGSRNPEQAYVKAAFTDRFSDQLSAIADGANRNGFWEIISFALSGVKERTLMLDGDVRNGDDVRSRIDILKDLLQAIDRKYSRRSLQ